MSTLTGELRIAPSGQEFFQHPDSKVILLRPQEDKAVALEKPANTTMATVVVHSAQKINNNFLNAFGRLPTDNERKIWQLRTDKDGAALLGAMQYAYQQEQAGVDQVMAEVGNLENKVLGYSSDFDPILFPEIPQYDELPQLPRVEFDIPFDFETLELVEPVAAAKQVSDQMAQILGNQEDYSEGVLQWLMSYPIAPSTVDGLQYYRDNPLYQVIKDPDFIAGTVHPEADSAYRISRWGQISGNQALYDASGNLIGSSPDNVSPLSVFNGLILHQVFDVLPYYFAKWAS